jgi:hypothetical protein
VFLIFFEFLIQKFFGNFWIFYFIFNCEVLSWKFEFHIFDIIFNVWKNCFFKISFKFWFFFVVFLVIFFVISDILFSLFTFHIFSPFLYELKKFSPQFSVEEIIRLWKLLNKKKKLHKVKRQFKFPLIINSLFLTFISLILRFWFFS